VLHRPIENAPLIGMWLLLLFRKLLRARSHKPLNLYGRKWAIRVFQKQLILEHRSHLSPAVQDRLFVGRENYQDLGTLVLA
jgi:hypothetical protein